MSDQHGQPTGFFGIHKGQSVEICVGDQLDWFSGGLGEKDSLPCTIVLSDSGRYRIRGSDKANVVRLPLDESTAQFVIITRRAIEEA